MIVGHFGFAAAVKSRVPAAPTWALMLASVWMDVLFVPLLVAHVETMEPYGGGNGHSYGGAIIHADWTHSLLGALVIAAVFGVGCALAWGTKIGCVMGGVVFSHWVLDVPMHHHDMPLLPANAGDLPRVGFGLWSLPAAAALLELALLLAGAWLYWQKARSIARDPVDVTRANRAGIAMVVAGLVTLALSVAGM